MNSIVTKKMLIDPNIVKNNSSDTYCVIAVRHPIMENYYRTFVIPYLNTHDLVKHFAYDAQSLEELGNQSDKIAISDDDHRSLPVKKPINLDGIKVNTKHDWTTRSQIWKKWSDLRKAISAQCKYIASVKHSSGLFRCYVYDTLSDYYVTNQWFSVVKLNASGKRAIVTPRSKWTSLNAVYRHRQEAFRDHKFTRLAEQVASAKDNASASQIMLKNVSNHDRLQMPIKNQYDDTKAVIGIGDQIVKAISFSLIEDGKEIREYDAKYDLPQPLPKLLQQTGNDAKTIQNVSMKRFYVYTLKTHQLKLATLDQIAKVAKHYASIAKSHLNK